MEADFIARPPAGRGPGILVLHAWWGLNDFLRGFCQRLANEGFVIMAPDLYHGRTAATIEQAKALFEQELEKSVSPEVVEIKKKVKADENYEPNEQEIEEIKTWTRNPEVYLDEGQLQKVYDFEPGSIWDFFWGLIRCNAKNLTRA